MGPTRLPCVRARAFFAVGLASLACGCRPGVALDSAVLITLDTTRADALGCYGAGPSPTPHLDQMAREGLVYERAHTVAPLTLPAHASMLTGLYPLRHGLRDNGIWTLPEGADTLAEAARAAGVETAAFLGSVVLDGGFGLGQGFEHYDVPPRALLQSTSEYSERPGHEVVARALAWLRSRDRRKPFFLWVHLWDAHAPYDPAPEYRERAGGNAYRGEVAAADAAVGELLAFLREDGSLARALVVAVADHGEAFGEHGELSHSAFCYEPTLHVPLILRYPDGFRAGERSGENASVVDLAPTLADALGVALPADIDGSSLFRRALEPDRGVYFESYYGYLAYGWSPLSGWLDAEGKYLHSSEPELFDPVADRAEERDLIAERPDLAEKHRAAIARIAARPALAPGEGAVDEDLRRSIQALGYAAMGGGRALPPPLEPSERPSPARRATEQKLFQQAMTFLVARRNEEALAILESILAENPGNVLARARLALCQARGGENERAIENLERVVAVGHAHADDHFLLGTCLERVGRRDEAIAALERALVIDPGHVQSLESLVTLLGQAGRNEEAAQKRRALRKLQGGQ